jgi:hypothetical protein
MQEEIRTNQTKAEAGYKEFLAMREEIRANQAELKSAIEE